MEPNLKMVLEEMKSMKTSLENSIASVNSSLGSRIGAVERTISDRFGRPEDAVKVFVEWKPAVDSSVQELCAKIGTIRQSGEAVDKLREEMMALRKTISRTALEATVGDASGVLHPPVVTTSSPLFGMPPSGAAMGAPIFTAGPSYSAKVATRGTEAGDSFLAGSKVNSLFGPGVETLYQGFEFQTHSPVKGTSTFPPYCHPTPQSLPRPSFAMRKSLSSSHLDTGQSLEQHDTPYREAPGNLGAPRDSDKLPS